MFKENARCAENVIFYQTHLTLKEFSGNLVECPNNLLLYTNLQQVLFFQAQITVKAFLFVYQD